MSLECGIHLFDIEIPFFLGFLEAFGVTSSAYLLPVGWNPLDEMPPTSTLSEIFGILFGQNRVPSLRAMKKPMMHKMMHKFKWEMGETLELQGFWS